MASATAALYGSPVLRSSFLAGERDSSSFEVSSSNRVGGDGGSLRVRCVVQNASQRSSRETDLATSSFTSLSSSSTSEEWWRRQTQSQCSRNPPFDSRAFGAASSGSGLISGPTLADWQLDEPTWTQHPLEETPTSRGRAGGVPVFVMLPLDSVNMATNTVNRKRATNASLLALKSAGVEGIMMDVWWGIVEKDGPRQYNWSAYRDLIEMARKHGLKVQAVMSFHQCGGNVGDSCK